MKKLILITIAFAACTSQVKHDSHNTEHSTQKSPSTTLELNNGNKWNTDESTKKNVAAMIRIINNSEYSTTEKKGQLYMDLQQQIDNLIKECRMQGAAHDALHLWLENVLEKMKELKSENVGFTESYTALKQAILSFHTFFE